VVSQEIQFSDLGRNAQLPTVGSDERFELATLIAESSEV